MPFTTWPFNTKLYSGKPIHDAKNQLHNWGPCAIWCHHLPCKNQYNHLIFLILTHFLLNIRYKIILSL